MRCSKGKACRHALEAEACCLHFAWQCSSIASTQEDCSGCLQAIRIGDKVKPWLCACLIQEHHASGLQVGSLLHLEPLIPSMLSRTQLWLAFLRSRQCHSHELVCMQSQALKGSALQACPQTRKRMSEGHVTALITAISDLHCEHKKTT